MVKKLWDLAESRIKELYGEKPPLAIMERLESEFQEYGGNEDFESAVLFISRLRREAEKKRSDIFCRGLLNNSFVAWLAGATRVNPLPAHYYCPKCKQIEFVSETTGWDLPEKRCSCGARLERDGHNLTHRLSPGKRFSCADISIPSSLQSEIKQHLETYYESDESTKVYEVHLFPGFDGSAGIVRYVILNEWECLASEAGKVLYMDGDEFYERFRYNMYYCIFCSDTLDCIQRCAERTNKTPAQSELVQPEIIEAFKEAGRFRSFLDYLTAEQNKADDALGVEHLEERYYNIQYYLDHYSCDSFSDLLRLEGLSHDTYDPSKEYTDEMLRCFNKDDVIAFRDDVFDHIKCAMDMNAVQGDSLAVRISETARKGKYSKGRMDQKTVMILQSLGISNQYISSLCHALYLFPRGHCIDYLRLNMIAAWYAVNTPEIFNTVLGEI